MEGKLTVAAVQLGPYPEDKAEALNRIVSLTEAAKERGAEVVCFPELSTTYYFHGFAEANVEHLYHEEPFPALAPVAEAARRLGLYILLPIPEKSGLAFYNSAL